MARSTRGNGYYRVLISAVLRLLRPVQSAPNRNSPPAILLRESYREGGKVGKRTLFNLSDWPKAHIEWVGAPMCR